MGKKKRMKGEKKERKYDGTRTKVRKGDKEGERKVQYNERMNEYILIRPWLYYCCCFE